MKFLIIISGILSLSLPARAALPVIPAGPAFDSARRGLLLLSHTSETMKNHSHVKLNCTSCHLDGGTVSNSGSWVGVTQAYPMYSAREGRRISIQDRVNECFVRSLNAKSPAKNSPEMRDFVAYLTWLSRKVLSKTERTQLGFKPVLTKQKADLAHGVQLYIKQCAACHGTDGAGLLSKDHKIVYPALWGDQSFNLGAGMARLNTATSFIKWSMPLGEGGTLKDQDAKDIAAYVIQQPRPDFKNKNKDWPHGNKPDDARY